MTQNPPRPRIALLTTGGTIAMTAQGGRGGQLALDGAALSASVPGIETLAEIEVRPVLAKPSASFTLSDLGRIAAAAQEAAEMFDGVVITHGTDTLEETAFALALLTRAEAPIVMTSAMRRPDQLGADGPANLAAAIRVAASAKARGLGLLVVSDDEIHVGALVRKTHSFRPHAFSSAPFGPIGWVAEGRVRIALKPAFDLPHLAYPGGEPVVPIVEAGPGLEPKVVEALAPACDGLVVALPGAGHVAAAAVAPLAALAAERPVVFASRTGAGETLQNSYGFGGGEIELLAKGLIGAGPLDARKARVLLQLLLAEGAGVERVRAAFAGI
ncbi:asparaginase [Phenylobacterium montanum]|uniref:Asparaginase n=1 Tax=Phenylobacterium montanum TaxID=2823693 RepID=A0A975IVW6_9CAUL|nr:asparaginase [Caulobacter sp. S6]QUD89432.1 asparaginase [Caulobacter sp. S6]